MNKEDWNFEALRFLLQNTYTNDEACKMNLLNISDGIIADETVGEETTLAERTYDALKPELKEVKGCNCGYKVEEGCKGCGKAIEEWTKEDDEGMIIDNGWYHCGENGILCDGCKKTKRDALLGETVQ